MIALSGMAAHAARRVDKLKKETSVESLRGRPLYARVARDLGPALKPGAKIVEVRFAEEGTGLLVRREFADAPAAAQRAIAAEKDGAAAVAIWCEHNFHAGDYGHLEAARAVCPELLLIARDLIIDPWQLERIRACGADAVELIPDLLGPAFNATAAATRNLGLTPVVFGPGLALRLA
jgi:indole-3-glycerol phosphate synthase